MIVCPAAPGDAVGVSQRLQSWPFWLHSNSVFAKWATNRNCRTANGRGFSSVLACIRMIPGNGYCSEVRECSVTSILM